MRYKIDRREFYYKNICGVTILLIFYYCYYDLRLDRVVASHASVYVCF